MIFVSNNEQKKNVKNKMLETKKVKLIMKSVLLYIPKVIKRDFFISLQK